MLSDKDNEADKKGIIVDLLKEMEKIINASIEIVLVKDNKWGNLNEEGNWTGMIGEVKSGVSTSSVFFQFAKHSYIHLEFLN